MAALNRPSPHDLDQFPTSPHRSPAPASARPQFRVIAGGRSGGRAGGSSGRTAGRTALRPTAAQYRRRRLAALVLVAAVLLAAGVAAQSAADRLGSAPLAAPEAAPAVAAVPLGGRTTYVVQPGDTLWSIAEHLSPTGDIRLVVEHLAALNGGATIQVGDVVRLE